MKNCFRFEFKALLCLISFVLLTGVGFASQGAKENKKIKDVIVRDVPENMAREIISRNMNSVSDNDRYVFTITRDSCVVCPENKEDNSKAVEQMIRTYEAGDTVYQMVKENGRPIMYKFIKTK